MDNQAVHAQNFHLAVIDSFAEKKTAGRLSLFLFFLCVCCVEISGRQLFGADTTMSFVFQLPLSSSHLDVYTGPGMKGPAIGMTSNSCPANLSIKRELSGAKVQTLHLRVFVRKLAQARPYNQDALS